LLCIFFLFARCKGYVVSTTAEHQAKSDSELIILGISNYQDSNGDFQLAFSYSCKALLENAIRQRDSIPDGSLCFYSDATFNIVHEDWARYSFGCNELRRDNTGQCRGHYRPFAFGFARTERTEGYIELFSSTSKYIETHYGITLQCDFIVGDRFIFYNLIFIAFYD
jgi:hypothetical protein